MNPAFAAFGIGTRSGDELGRYRGLDYTNGGQKTIPFTIRYGLGSSDTVHA